MKVRKLAVALALAGGLGSGVAQALGLGEIELQSYLNEPLDAEIVLPQSRGVDPGDVFVNIAPESAYERVGLDRHQFLSKLRFEVVTARDGSLIVNVTSREPIREPYLNFLVELTWPNGRLMREYAVLVDPPVYAEESGLREQVAAPASTARPAVSAPRSESQARRARAEQSLAPRYSADTFGPTGPSDTLWTIAAQVKPSDNVSMQQVMLAIQDLNPDAFIGGNINRLKRGEVLRIPTEAQMQRRSRAEAVRLVSQQNQEFQTPRRVVDATAERAAQAAAGAPASGGDELKLLVADNEGARDPEAGGSAGGDSDLPGGVDAGTAIAMEELESARRENEELSSRVEDLQDQVETLQRLLELKNSQLADLQRMADEQGEAVAETGEEAPSDVAMDGAESADAPETVTAETDAAIEDAGTDEPAPAEADDDAMAEGVMAESGDLADSGETLDDTAAADDAVEMVEAQEMVDSAIAEPGASDTDSRAEDVAEAPMAPGVADQQPESAQPAPQPVKPAQVEKGFPGNVIDAITNNTMYQIALGGGLIVLLLLLLAVARRNARREKEFYEQLNSEDSSGEADSFDLSLDDEESEAGETSDAISEADAYIAYGRHDQAAQTLETAISREPSRTDLRLKLLGVYADTQDRDSFEKQFGEIEALDDEDALAEAKELRARLEEAEAMPSIDELESQLRSDSFSTTDQEPEAESSELSDELLADQYDAQKEEQVENEFGEFDSDLSDFDLDEIEKSEEVADEAADLEQDEAQSDLIEYDLSDVSVGDDETLESGESSTQEESEEPATSGESDDYTLDFELDEGEREPSAEADQSLEDELSLDLESEADQPAAEPETGSESETPDSELEGLDESFLDELDAELDKVSEEDESELVEDAGEGAGLDELELDVSDEDLALMEEFSDLADTDSEEPSGEDLSLDEELGLEDTLAEDEVLSEETGPEHEVAAEESVIEELESPDESEDSAGEGAAEEADDFVPVASEKVGDEAAKSAVPDIDESELGDDDDFDFLAGTDEAATKLDLARAYIEMGDSEGARDILEEVALEGNDEQKAEAQELLKNLS